MMQWQGRAGMWTDWLEFQKQAKQKREEARRAELRKAAKRKASIIAGLMWTTTFALLGVLMALGLWVVQQLKGK
jgi:cytoskeletal protein RodZ